MAQRNWSSLGEAQRKRYLGWGRKQGWSEERTRRYYNEGGSLKAARGKPANEYQERRRREKIRAGRFHPLTPTEIKQIRHYGGTDGDLDFIKTLSHADVKRHLKIQRENQRRYDSNPNWNADWSAEEWKDENEGIPEVFMYYHGSSVWR